MSPGRHTDGFGHIRSGVDGAAYEKGARIAARAPFDGFAVAYLGASTISIWRPSMRG